MYNTLAKKLKWLNSDTLINHLLKHQIHIICTWSFQSSLSVTDVEYLWMAPVCNRDVLKKHSEHQKEEEIPSVIELANCGLHTVHDVLQTGTTQSACNFHTFFPVVRKMFDESSTRRDIYIRNIM